MNKGEDGPRTKNSISAYLIPTPTLQEYYQLGNMYRRTVNIAGVIKWKDHFPEAPSPNCISNFEVYFPSSFY